MSGGSSDSIDDNIDNYSIDNLLELFGLVEANVFQIQDAANGIIARMRSMSNDKMATFLEKARDKLLRSIPNINDIEPYDETYEEDERPGDPIENDTTTSLSDVWSSSGFTEKGDKKVKYFADLTHFIAEQLKQEPPAIVPPIIYTRIINIDSQYRSSILPYDNRPLSTTFNTNFSFNLSSPIKKAISMTLNSIQLPTTWYTFGKNMGNSFFVYDGIQIIIPDGNYSIFTLVAKINEIALQNIATNKLVVSYNAETNHVSFYNGETLSDKVTIIFFDQSNVVNYNNCGLLTFNDYQFIGINTTLGWLLGFRIDPDPITGNVTCELLSEQTLTASAMPDTYGSTYFTLSVEDYSNRRLTGGLMAMNNDSGLRASLRYTDYFKTIQVNCKLNEGSPTQNEQYVVNTIISDNTQKIIRNVKNTLNAPISGSVLALIPLRDIKNIRPDPYIIYGADLQNCKRTYSMPAYIDRLNVRLNDDKGNLVNLNDVNWSFSLIIEERLN